MAQSTQKWDMGQKELLLNCLQEDIQNDKQQSCNFFETS